MPQDDKVHSFVIKLIIGYHLWFMLLLLEIYVPMFHISLLSPELPSMLKLNFNGPASHLTNVRFPCTLKSRGVFELKRQAS